MSIQLAMIHLGVLEAKWFKYTILWGGGGAPPSTRCNLDDYHGQSRSCTCTFSVMVKLICACLKSGN